MSIQTECSQYFIKHQNIWKICLIHWQEFYLISFHSNLLPWINVSFKEWHLSGFRLLLRLNKQTNKIDSSFSLPYQVYHCQNESVSTYLSRYNSSKSLPVDFIRFLLAVPLLGLRLKNWWAVPTNIIFISTSAPASIPFHL